MPRKRTTPYATGRSLLQADGTYRRETPDEEAASAEAQARFLAREAAARARDWLHRDLAGAVEILVDELLARGAPATAAFADLIAARDAAAGGEPQP